MLKYLIIGSAIFLSWVSISICGSSFDVQEKAITPSPNNEKQLSLSKEVKVIDFDVSPITAVVAILASDKNDISNKVIFWDFPHADRKPTSWTIPRGIIPESIVWHPSEHKFFVLGTQGKEHLILSVSFHEGNWEPKIIYRTSEFLRRLVVGPSLFEISYNEQSAEKITTTLSYRLFFGVRLPNKRYKIQTITENGEKLYDVLSPEKPGKVKSPDEPGYSPTLYARSALPIGFHPAGHLMVWEDESHHFYLAEYGRDTWAKTRPIDKELKGGSITLTPNGMGLIHWRSGIPGVTLIYDHGRTRKKAAGQYVFLSTPSSVPDGKGIVGLIQSGQEQRLVYVPIDMPLYDVKNAWMFIESPTDVDRFVSHGGLFRSLDLSQLYSLYDTENYYCGDYDRSAPTRPYFVTTDVFWELFAAAYEGIFILNEKEHAIPSFWEFLRAAQKYYEGSGTSTPWKSIFTVLRSIEDRAAPGGDERDRIEKAEGEAFSPILGRIVDYSELKPRGHYATNLQFTHYFQAMHYLSSISPTAEMTDNLSHLPMNIKKYGISWIDSYKDFIGPSRHPLVWRRNASIPKYVKHPDHNPTIIPLSWGFDNEVLNSVVYHHEWPISEQIIGPEGPRILPNGLDVPAAMGSGFALGLLRDEGYIARYPQLKERYKDLQGRFRTYIQSSSNSGSLYERWLNALAVQWADDVAPPTESNNERLWRVKRLQTGLASWATLRHSTVLVNERAMAECGEAGFEPIVYQPPRGYVEPDPATFGQIALLFDASIKIVQSSWAENGAIIHTGNIGSAWNEDKPELLKAGIIRRLTESAEQTRRFGKIASKEIKGEPLTNEEYNAILYAGRVAEHNFLIFKSLANKDFALSTPDPVPKVADVAGGKSIIINGKKIYVPYFFAAVGTPLEWDNIVPYFGRHIIVKGVTYSYYKFESDKPMDDREWRTKLSFQPRDAAEPTWMRPESQPSKSKQPRPRWIEPFISSEVSSCPPNPPF